MINADSPMNSVTAFAAAVNRNAAPRGARGMRPHERLPRNGSDDSERNSGPSWLVSGLASPRRPAQTWLAFGPFRLCPSQRLLLGGGRPLRLGSRAFDILIALIERAGDVVDKQHLIARVWPRRIIEDANIRVQVNALRRVLQDDQIANRYICTIPGRGYCFVAPVANIRLNPQSTAPRKSVCRIGGCSIPIDFPQP